MRQAVRVFQPEQQLSVVNLPAHIVGPVMVESFSLNEDLEHSRISGHEDEGNTYYCLKCI
jgi:hypothetical protein